MSGLSPWEGEIVPFPLLNIFWKERRKVQCQTVEEEYVFQKWVWRLQQEIFTLKITELITEKKGVRFYVGVPIYIKQTRRKQHYEARLEYDKNKACG